MRIPVQIALLSVAFSLSLFCAGCALTSKADSVVFRYFSPEVPSPAGRAAETAVGRGLELRIGRVAAAAYLKDRIVFREGVQELHYYDRLRWSEKPEAFVRRAVGRALFEERGLRELVSRSGPTLEIELDVLDELRGSAPTARARATWLVRDEQTVLVQKTITIDRTIGPKKSPPEVAKALGEALAEVVQTIAAEAVTALQRSVAAPRPAATAP